MFGIASLQKDIIVYRVMLALLQILMPDTLKLSFENFNLLQHLPSKVDGQHIVEAA